MMIRLSQIVMSACLCFAVLAGFAQEAPRKGDPKLTEQWDPPVRVITPGKTAADAPSDAIVLFGGKDASKWKAQKDGGPVKWKIEDNALVVAGGTGGIETKEGFGDCQLHIEWRTPAEVKGESQGRGNSGIFLMGRYELQVLDSYNNPTYSNGQAGSIYKQSMPMVNASLAPGAWQTYDVIYTAPKFNKDGMMIHPPYITVLHNGVLIQNHTAIRGTTPFVGLPQVKPHGKGPIKLQDHQNPTSFRNIWIREL